MFGRSNSMLALPCAAFALASIACAGPPPGSPCSSPGDCKAEHICVDDMRGNRRCMLPCTTERLCSDGAVCLDDPNGGGARVCWYGGRTAFGAPCADTLECEPGTVCVEGDGATACRQACLYGDDRPCRSGTETCEPIASSWTDGYCKSLLAPDAGAPPTL